MIKVMNILTDTNIGGAGRLLVNYLHNFDRAKFDVCVVLPKNSQLKPFVEAERWQVMVIEHGADKSFDMGAVGEIENLIKKWKPDIVHTHSSFSGKLAAYLTHVPCRFYTRHCAFPQPKKLTTFPGKQLNGLVNNTLATDIVAVAKAAEDNLLETGISPKKVTVIINGVEKMRKTTPEEQSELKKSLGIPEDAFVCGISARLEEYKGHRYLLESAKIVTEKHPNTYFLIIGGGSEEQNLRNLAMELGISTKVIFTGFVNDVAPYYNIMNLNLNCSIGTETSSLALSEGMSLSIPAIATTYGGNPYMITDGVNGFLVPERDPAAMAERICEIIENPSLYAQLSKGAYEMYEKKFTASAMTRQLEELYEKSYAKHVGK